MIKPLKPRPTLPQTDIPRCPGCGCELSDYEVFACRIRGLKKPVCVGCMAGALVFVRDGLLPLLDSLETAVLKLADKVPLERLEHAEH